MMFLAVNETAHTAFAMALARRGVVIRSVMPVGNPYDMPDWLGDHWQRHIEECATLHVPVPDLSSADLNDEQEYMDWMELHGQLHRQQNMKLGITT